MNLTQFAERSKTNITPFDPLPAHHGLEGAGLRVMDHEAPGQGLLGRDLEEVGEVTLLVKLHVVRAGDELGHRPQVGAAILAKLPDSLQQQSLVCVKLCYKITTLTNIFVRSQLGPSFNPFLDFPRGVVSGSLYVTLPLFS